MLYISTSIITAAHKSGAIPTNVRPKTLMELAIEDTEHAFSPVIDEGLITVISVLHSFISDLYKLQLHLTTYVDF